MLLTNYKHTQPTLGLSVTFVFNIEYIYTHTYIHIHIHTHIYTHIHTYIYLEKIYIYIYTYIHSYTYTPGGIISSNHPCACRIDLSNPSCITVVCKRGSVELRPGQTQHWCVFVTQSVCMTVYIWQFPCFEVSSEEYVLCINCQY